MIWSDVEKIVRKLAEKLPFLGITDSNIEAFVCLSPEHEKKKKIKVWCEVCCGCGISNIRTKWADDCWWEYSYCVKCGGKGYIIKLV